MRLPMDLILDRMRYLNPEAHLKDPALWVKGVKLLPPATAGLSADYLYLTERTEDLDPALAVPVAVVAPEEVPSPLPESCVVLRTRVPLPDIFNELLGLQALLQDWDLQLNLSVSRGMGIQHLLELSEPVLGNPVLVLDPAFKCLASTTSFETDDRVFDELLTLGYLTQDSFNLLRDHDYFTQDHYTGQTLILPPSSIKNYTSTFTAVLDEDKSHVRYEILMLFCNSPYSDGLLQLFLYLQSKILTYLQPEQERKDDSHARYEYFVIDLLEERCTDAQEIMERSKCFLGYDGDGLNAMVVRLNRSTDMYRKHAIFTLQSMFPDLRPILYHDSIVLFPNLGNPRQNPTPSAAAVLSSLTDFLVGADAYAGISIQVKSLDRLRGAYLQAEESLTLGRRMGGKQRVFWYSDYYVYRILDAATTPTAIPSAELMNDLFLDIERADAEKGTDGLHILMTFLRCGMNYTDAGKALHMHRNNVIYHIRRMEELFRMNLSDPELRLQLLLSERLRQMFPREGDPASGN